jgi:hypothetical protein
MSHGPWIVYTESETSMTHAEYVEQMTAIRSSASLSADEKTRKLIALGDRAEKDLPYRWYRDFVFRVAEQITIILGQ